MVRPAPERFLALASSSHDTWGKAPERSRAESRRGPMETWLKTKRRKDLCYSLLISGLSLVAGLGAVSLVFGLFWMVALLLAAFATGGKYQSIAWPLALTSAATTLLFIDSLHSRRDDFSNIPLWLLRESLGVGPRLFLEGVRRAQRARLLARLKVDECAAALGWLAGQRHSVSREQVQRAFPDLVWTELRAQLQLIEGVLFLRNDFSRVILSAPLRLRLRQWQVHQPKPQPAPEPAEAPPITEPEKLSAHEILGVSPSASIAEIKQAYRARVKECHPDRFANMDELSRNLAEEWTKALNGAYASLVAKRTGARS